MKGSREQIIMRIPRIIMPSMYKMISLIPYLTLQLRRIGKLEKKGNSKLKSIMKLSVQIQLPLINSNINTRIVIGDITGDTIEEEEVVGVEEVVIIEVDFNRMVDIEEDRVGMDIRISNNMEGEVDIGNRVVDNNSDAPILPINIIIIVMKKVVKEIIIVQCIIKNQIIKVITIIRIITMNNHRTIE